MGEKSEGEIKREKREIITQGKGANVVRSDIDKPDHATKQSLPRTGNLFQPNHKTHKLVPVQLAVVVVPRHCNEGERGECVVRKVMESRRGEG